MKLRLSIVASVCLAFSLSAHASDIAFNVTNGIFSPSGTFSGSFLIDSSTELIDGGQFNIIAPSGGTAYSFFNNSNDSSTPGLALFADNKGDSFKLALNGSLSTLAVNTLAIFGTSGDTFFTNAAGARFDATSATVSRAPSTPEPSSLILLGTGALGLIGAARRRLLNA